MPLSVPRTWVVGETVTAAQLNTEIRDQFTALRADRLFARKSANTARNTTTTRTADPHLTLAVVANAVYLVDGFLIYGATSATDLSVAWSIPTGASGAWTGWCIGLGTTTSTNDGYPIRTEGRTDLTQAQSMAGVGSPELVSAQLRATLVTGANDGTFAVVWAQATSGAIDTTVYANSWIRAVRIS